MEKKIIFTFRIGAVTVIPPFGECTIDAIDGNVLSITTQRIRNIKGVLTNTFRITPTSGMRWKILE